MSFLPKEPDTFINIKLTDDGRRLLSLGALTFSKAVVSDREINYSIDRTGSYNILNNKVLAPKDSHPNININLDSTAALLLSGQQVNSFKKIVSASTTIGFFTGTTDTYAIDPAKFTGKGVLEYSASTMMPSGGTSIGVTDISGNQPSQGDLMYIQWEPFQATGKTYVSSTILEPENSTLSMWYRVISAATGSSETTLTVDRNLPNFGGGSSSQRVNVYFYPYNGVEAYYGSGYTSQTKAWNLNILRTSSIVGTSSTVSGYTSYGSIEYNGFKTYLGFLDETREIGIVHYTNNWTGNTFGEQLGEKSIKIEIPNILWHKYAANLGEAKKHGVTLYDSYGDTIFDEVAQTTYRELRDGTSSNNVVVGRVYHKLKLFVITDPELLVSMTYKSNRNYTLPATNLTLVGNPKYPLTTSQATGLCKTGYTYYVTYLTDSESAYTHNVSFGYPKTLPCGYIKKIEGQHDSSNNPQYLSITFPNSSFPYLRNSTNMTSSSYSGTGWNANKVQILVNEVDDESLLDFNTIPANGWKLISNGVGNGIYTGETSDTTIDPLKLSAYQFVISREDLESGSTYVLDSTFTSNNDPANYGLNFGAESFFFGTITTGVVATAYKTVMTIFCKNNEFNSTDNVTFDSNIDTNTYITEVGILSNDNTLVAVGKPTYPIKKSNSKYIAFQLEIDF